MSKLDEAIEILRDSECSFWACPGPDVEPVDMATCSIHWAYYYLVEYRNEIDE